MARDDRDDQLTLLEEQVGVFLRRSRRFVRGFARRVHPEIDATAYTVLVVLAQAAPVRLNDLAEEFGVDKSTMSRQITTLTRLGLVTREPDPVDGRAFLLAPSADGASRLRAVADARRGAWRARLDGWSEPELTELVAMLTRLNTDVNHWFDDLPGNSLPARR